MVDEGHGQAADPFERPDPPSRRRPRRPNTVTYRVRIELDGTRPVLWRRLELASDLVLDEVHDAVQVAFGWTDSHLHRFACGTEYYAQDTEFYPCPFEVEEGEPGIPEDRVRLDEVLAEVGDRLFYLYDFGDNWQHTIALEAVLPRQDGTPRALCTAGQQPGPAEDCGGVWGYELIVAATDPAHPDHSAAAAEYAQCFGTEADPAWHSPAPFDLDAINEAIAGLGIDRARPDIPLAQPLAELVAAVRTSDGKRLLRRLITDACGAPVEIDADTAARMVHPYAWLLDRVGSEGIALTSAGYLPPVDVEAAVRELGLDAEWVGKGNRESQTLPVLHLRESAQKSGLLRKHRGRLVLTPRGRAVRSDPVALWWRLAEQLPLKSSDPCEIHAGLLSLLVIATNVDDRDALVADLLSAMGWACGDGTPITGMMAYQAAWDTTNVLRRLGGFADNDLLVRHESRATSGGRAFARVALSTWPDGQLSKR